MRLRNLIHPFGIVMENNLSTLKLPLVKSLSKYVSLQLKLKLCLLYYEELDLTFSSCNLIKYLFVCGCFFLIIFMNVYNSRANEISTVYQVSMRTVETLVFWLWELEQVTSFL